MAQRISKTFRIKREVFSLLEQGVNLQNKALNDQGLDNISMTEFVEKAIVSYYNSMFNLEEIARIKDSEHKYIYDVISKLVYAQTETITANQKKIQDDLDKVKDYVKAGIAGSDCLGKFSNDRINGADIQTAINNWMSDENIIDRIKKVVAIKKQEANNR